MTSTKFIICAMCGLPASGKTTLCRLLSELATVRGIAGAEGAGGWPGTADVVHLCYDKIIPQNLDPTVQLVSSNNSQVQQHTLWKEYRRQIIECLDFIIGEVMQKQRTLLQVITNLQIGNGIPSSDVQDISAVQREVWMKMADCLSGEAVQGNDKEHCVIILIDDNMFYRSMRYNLYQLARKYSTGFCQIGFECRTDIAIKRNARRKDKIPEETIVTMATRIEQPDASKAPWEANSILIEADEEFDHFILGSVWMLLLSSFLSPAPPLIEEDLEAKEQSRAECASSLLHQADQVLRKYISQTITSSKDELSSTKLRDLASALNQGKTTILDELRKGSLTPPDLPADAESRENFNDFFKNCLRGKTVK
ncbi:L-seryl-tRNA(Sec) kinase-like [Lytechinus pictus]|uniref:L-seryl-tRNA(Sec) kinase-like n=1 Tax=Lytechinus pictus TaxID=7653 RepID=UPI0030B9C6FD